MAPSSKKSTETTDVDYTAEDADPAPAPAPAPATESTEPKTGTPTPEAIRAERERVENIHHPHLPDALNSEGEIVSTGDQPPADVQIDDMRAMIPPPPTSSYVTFPDELRDEADNDQADLHRTKIYNELGEEVGEKGHWVQVVQVRTFDDGRVPQVSFRCECNREYVLDWIGDLAERVVKVSRT